MKPPRHAFEVEIHVGGETWGDTLREIQRFCEHIERHGPECNLASGGAGSAGHITVWKRDVTPAQYRRELEEWAQQRTPTEEPQR